MTTLRRPHFLWLIGKGVPLQAILYPDCIVSADLGELHFRDDDVFWRPKEGTLRGGWCLGYESVYDACTYSMDGSLRLYATPLEWLRAGRNGCVVRDWSQAFDKLRDVPRVTVPQELVKTYRNAMRVPRLPEMRVIRPDEQSRSVPEAVSPSP